MQQSSRAADNVLGTPERRTVTALPQPAQSFVIDFSALHSTTRLRFAPLPERSRYPWEVNGIQTLHSIERERLLCQALHCSGPEPGRDRACLSTALSV